MSETPIDRSYAREHEWVRVDDDDDAVVAIGITDYAQSKMGDIVMVELPEVGDEVDKDGAIGAVESPKSVSDVFSPVAGEILSVNEELEDTPELVNDDAWGEGWLCRIRMSDPQELEALMDAAAYDAFCSEEDEE